MTDLSVVILCYHSGKTIAPFFAELESLLKEAAIDYEIVLVANDFAHSKDQTIEIVKALAKDRPRVKTVCKIKQGMMGWDMIQGLDASTGKYICVIDGDGQFPIDSILKVYDKIREGQYDLVKTYRDQRFDGMYRIVISGVYNFLFRILFPGLHSKDINSKPKIITREAYSNMDLQSTDWFIDAEIMIHARELKLSIAEIPIIFSANESRKSFVRFGAILEFIYNLIVYRIKH
ncbi:MAG: glycosyltransferase family 2 protein [Bacteroidales bacterium]|nr:glycosyltransferase family 2 protein [Bacteroidales bacterium]